MKCRIIKQRGTGLPAGYGFVDFSNPQSAEIAFATLNGQPIPSTLSPPSLRWYALVKWADACRVGSHFVWGFADLPGKRFKLNWAGYSSAAGAGGGVPGPKLNLPSIHVSDIADEATEQTLLVPHQLTHNPPYLCVCVSLDSSAVCVG